MIAPRATYRLQLNPAFGFADAAAAVPYLAELGVSHLYLSPVLQAAPGSTHGYDVVDPDRVSEELGGEAGFAALVTAAKAAGLGILLDIVPNHMSIAGTANRYWMDVLENGPASYYAHYFDVDWGTGGDDRVMLPILGDRYGRALTNGVLGVVWPEPARGGPDAGIKIRAHDHLLPVAPRSLGPVVARAGESIRHAEMQFIGDALFALPGVHEPDAVRRRRRRRDRAVLLARLAALCASDPACREALAREIESINAHAFALDALLEAQNYRLVHWTVATSQLSYRRFFDITTLVGIRNEEPDVIEGTHARIFAWLRDGTIDGVRVDHVDGLREPGAYLRRVREVAPEAWIVVEKILAPGETLPAAWPIEGTTGYDFMERMDALFVDGEAEAMLTQTFVDYTGEPFDPPTESRKARLEVMTDALHSEVARLTELAVRACRASPACRDYTRGEIELALEEILAGYPTYRTYLGEAHDEAPRDHPGGEDAGTPAGAHAIRGAGADVDIARIASAVEAATRARPELDPDLLAFLEGALAFENASAEARELARVAQQVSGPIVAKGDEDTLLYRQVRLLVRCDVGSHVALLAASPAEIHRELAAGGARSLLATSTHDTKRSEDVRARIAAISEHAEAWREAVLRWGERARAGWGDVAPDRELEYAIWQTLVGAWPLPEPRAQAWAEKATREARRRTSWRKPDAAYEAARTAWLAAIYADAELVGEIAQLAARITPHGDRNALAQLLVKLTAPGVPDFYQGTEQRDDSLVDPDNRRPVDLGAARARLRELTAPPPPDDLSAAKLWTIRRVLELRRREPARFAGAYEPLAATGPHADRVFAFARRAGEERTFTVVPRRTARADGWRDTSIVLPGGAWRDVLTDQVVRGGAIDVGALWRGFPIALLIRA